MYMKAHTLTILAAENMSQNIEELKEIHSNSVEQLRLGELNMDISRAEMEPIVTLEAKQVQSLSKSNTGNENEFEDNLEENGAKENLQEGNNDINKDGLAEVNCE